MLQTYILYQLRGNNVEVDIDTSAVLLSVSFATLHMIFEGIIITLDARASKIDIFSYGIHCLGARMEWVPQTSVVLSKLDNEKRKLQRKEGIASHKNVFIDYSNVHSKLCNLTYRIQFEFTPESFSKLTQTLLSLDIASVYAMKDGIISIQNPFLNNLVLIRHPRLREQNLTKIKLTSSCLAGIDLNLMVQLLRAGNNRVLLDTSEINWQEICDNTLAFKQNNVETLTFLWKDYVWLGELNAVNILTRKLSRTSASHLYRIEASQKIEDQLLSIMNDNSNNSNKNERNLNAKTQDYLTILSKYYDNNSITFGFGCESAKLIYNQVFAFIDYSESNNDLSYLMCGLMILWYTQKCIFDHGCNEGCHTFRKMLFKRCKKQQYINSMQSEDPLWIDYFYHRLQMPRSIFINVSNYTTNGNKDIDDDTSDLLEISTELFEAFRVFKKDFETILIEKCCTVGSNVSNSIQTKENKAIIINAPDIINYKWIHHITKDDIHFLHMLLIESRNGTWRGHFTNDAKVGSTSSKPLPFHDTFAKRFEILNELVFGWKLKQKYLSLYFEICSQYQTRHIKKLSRAGQDDEIKQLLTKLGFTDTNSKNITDFLSPNGERSGVHKMLLKETKFELARNVNDNNNSKHGRKFLREIYRRVRINAYLEWRVDKDNHNYVDNYDYNSSDDSSNTNEDRKEDVKLDASLITRELATLQIYSEIFEAWSLFSAQIRIVLPYLSKKFCFQSNMKLRLEMCTADGLTVIPGIFSSVSVIEIHVQDITEINQSQGKIDEKNIIKKDIFMPYACETSNIAFARYLLNDCEKYFDPTRTNPTNGNNGLHIACKNSKLSPKLLRLLLNNKRTIKLLNRLNKQDETALDLLESLYVDTEFCSMDERSEMVVLLKSCGAIFNKVDSVREQQFYNEYEMQWKFGVDYRHFTFFKMSDKSKDILAILVYIFGINNNNINISNTKKEQNIMSVINLFVDILLSGSSLLQRQLFCTNQFLKVKMFSGYDSVLSFIKAQSENDFKHLDDSKLDSDSIDKDKDKDKHSKLNQYEMEIVELIFDALLGNRSNVDIWERRLRNGLEQVRNSNEGSVEWENGLQQVIELICVKTNGELKEIIEIYDKDVLTTKTLMDEMETFVEKGEASNNMDLMISMQCIKNLLTLVLRKEQSSLDSANFDSSSIPIDLLFYINMNDINSNSNSNSNSNKNKIDNDDIQRFSQFFLFLISASSWNYILQFNDFFMRQCKSKFVKNELENSQYVIKNYADYAQYKSNFPPLMMTLLRSSINVACYRYKTLENMLQDDTNCIKSIAGRDSSDGGRTDKVEYDGLRTVVDYTLERLTIDLANIEIHENISDKILGQRNIVADAFSYVTRWSFRSRFFNFSCCLFVV